MMTFPRARTWSSLESRRKRCSRSAFCSCFWAPSLVAAEAHVPSHGVLGAGAVVALAVGRRAAGLGGRQRRAGGGLRRAGIVAGAGGRLAAA